jgi:Transposase IS4
LLSTNSHPIACYRFLHGCNVLYDLVRPWANTNSIVVADSYYASVQAALRLKSIGLRFIGTVKTATKEFPMAYLAGKQMPHGRGDRHGVLSKADCGTTLLAYCWIDRDRRYFISTCSSLATGPPCLRERWTQVDRDTPDAEPEYLEIVVAQPYCSYLFHSAASKIDQHNKLRQASLRLETKMRTTLWHRRVNITLFGMTVIDSFDLAKGCQGNKWIFPPSSAFFEALAEDLIDNTFEQRALRKRLARVAAHGRHLVQPKYDGLLPASKQLCGPTPTKRYKKNKPTHHEQGKCMVCKQSTMTVCRECQDFQPDPRKKQFWICRKPGMECMGLHILDKHPDKAVMSDIEEEQE